MSIHGSDFDRTFENYNSFALYEESIVFGYFQTEFSSTGRALACEKMISTEFGSPERILLLLLWWQIEKTFWQTKPSAGIGFLKCEQIPPNYEYLIHK